MTYVLDVYSCTIRRERERDNLWQLSTSHDVVDWNGQESNGCNAFRDLQGRYQLHLHNHKIRSYGDGLTWMILSHTCRRSKKKHCMGLQSKPPQRSKKKWEKTKRGFHDIGTALASQRGFTVWQEFTKAWNSWTQVGEPNFKPQTSPAKTFGKPNQFPKSGKMMGDVFLCCLFWFPRAVQTGRFPRWFRGNCLKLKPWCGWSWKMPARMSILRTEIEWIYTIVGGFNQPIWKIWVKTGHLPQEGVKIKNIWVATT